MKTLHSKVAMPAGSTVSIFRKLLVVLFLLGSVPGLLHAQLSANFTHTVACDRTVTFINHSTGATTTSWNFGDANTSGDLSPTHQYAASGSFTVTLMVNNGILNSTTSHTITIYDPPGQSINGSLSLCENSQEVYSATTNGNSYQWTALGGTIISGQHTSSITVQWLTSGTGTIQLVETNALNCSSTTTIDVDVLPLPKPLFYLPSYQGSTGGLSSRFTVCQNGTSTHYLALPLNTGSTYLWEITGGTISGSAQTDSVTINWNTLGTGIIKITETSSSGCVGSYEATVTVISSPAANFTFADICLGSQANFTDLSIGSVQSWLWDFGDGAVSFEQNPSHLFGSAGTFHVTLTVTDADLDSSNFSSFCPSDTTMSINVLQNPGPEITCPGTVCAGDEETYSTPAVVGATYSWLVSGGTITSGGGASDNEVTIAWGNGPVGTISVQVTGTGIYCPLPTVVEIPIISPNPPISGPAFVCRWEFVTFDAPLLPGSTYNWGVTGGGYITSGQGTNSIRVYYPSTGTSNITLNVFHDLTDCSGQTTRTIQVLDQFYLSANNYACAQTSQTYTVGGTPATSGHIWNWSVTGGAITSGQGTNSINVLWGNGPIGEIVVNAPVGIYCNSQVTHPVTIKPLPPPAPLDGALQVCATSTVTYLTRAGYYNTWTVSGGTITSGGTVGSNYVSIQWGSGPTGQISLRQEDRSSFPYCATTTIFNVAISGNAPISISGPTPICANSTGTYTASSGSGIPYLWEVSGGTILSGFGTNIITVQWGDGPFGTIRVSEPICNNTVLLTVEITGVNVPMIDTLNLTCDGSSASLFVPGLYSSYLWNTAATTSLINITTPGTYSVTVTDANGCTANASVTLNTMPTLPIPAAYIAGEGPPATPIVVLRLTAFPNDNSYQWSTGSNRQSIYISAVGTYSVTVTNEFSCTAVTSVVVTANGGGISGGGGNCPGGGPGVICPGLNPDFTNSTCNPIHFTNTTSPAAVFYLWDFGDGSYDWVENPAYAFNSVGSFNVRLYASDNAVCWTVIQHPINIISLLDANFNITQGCYSQPIQFTDISTSALPITGWQWDFGDGNTSALQHPTHSYTIPGTYYITLTITDGICLDSFQDSIIIRDLTAAFGYQLACLGTPTLFTDNSSGSLEIVRWNWDFGDGSFSTLQNAAHQFAATGNYNVILSVTDLAGCTASSSGSVNVIQFIAGNISNSGPTTFCYGDSVTLTAPAGAGYTYLWSTGATTQSITVKQTGSYSAVVTDITGCKDEVGPVAVLVYLPPFAYITANGPVTFCQNAYYTTLSGNPYGPGFTYQWVKNGTALATTATYNISNTTHSGSYVIVVTDNHGCKDTSDAVVVTIYPNPPNPAINASGPTTFCEGGSVTLTAPAGYNYQWTNGVTTRNSTVFTSNYHQVTITDANGCIASSGRYVTVNPLPDMRLVAYGCYDVCISDNNQIHGPAGMSYQWSNGATTQSILVDAAGTYNLTATNNFGCSNSSDNLYISTTNFLGIALGNDTSFCNGGVALFDAGVGFTSYLWQDGSTTQTYSASASGDYYVDVTDVNGCLGRDSVLLTVFPNPVVTLPDVSFCDNSNFTLDAGSGFTSYLWNDNSTNETLTVASSGSYSVTVTDANNCQGSATGNITISNFIITTGPDVSICEGESVQLSASGGVTYSWFPDATLDNPNISNPLATPTASTTYLVSVTDVNGCSGQESVTVTVFPNPVVNLRDTTFCGNGNFILDAGSGFTSYSWSDNSTNQTLSVSTSGSYDVTVTNGNNCPGSSNANIIISNLIITAEPDTAICSGESVELTATGGVTYLWYPDATLDNPNISNPLATPLASTTYFVSVTDVNGCSGLDSVTVTVFPNPVVNLSDTTFCGNNKFTLDAGSGFNSYLWSNGSTDQILPVSTSGSYSVTVTDANNCQGSGSSNVIVSNFVITAGPDTTICAGESVQLTATGGVTYSWNPAATLDNPNISNPIATPVASTTYFVSVTNSEGCEETVSVAVNVSPILTADALSDTSICLGSTIQLSASGGTNFSWFPADALSCINCPNPFADPAQTTTYGVSVSQPGYCNNDTAYVTITILDLPEVGLEPVVTISSNSSVTLVPNSGFPIYTWSPVAGLSCYACENPTASPVTSTIYSLQVTDANGCTASGEIQVEVETSCAGKFAIPSAFSPNKDGVNDLFRIIHFGELQLITFKVFNRWGQMVFETDNPDMGWDGIYKDAEQDINVYTYYASMHCGNNINTITGNVTLIR